MDRAMRAVAALDASPAFGEQRLGTARDPARRAAGDHGPRAI
jgi:hypothetical protein